MRSALRRFAAHLVALAAPWRLGRASGSMGRLGPLVSVLAGLAVFPAIDGTHSVVEVLGDREELPAPQAGLMAALGEGIIEDEPLAAVALAAIVRVGTKGLAWLVGGAASGLLGLGLLAGLLRLLAVGGSREARSAVSRGAAAMVLWLPVATVPFTLVGRSWTSEHAAALLGCAAVVGAVVVAGAAAGAWSLLAPISRGRGAAGAIVVGLLVAPLLVVAAQPAVQALFLWQRLVLS